MSDHKRREDRVAEIEKWLSDKNLAEAATVLSATLGLEPTAQSRSGGLTNQKLVPRAAVQRGRDADA
jgi:hypothetical protein